MKNILNKKFYDISDVVVFVGPCSSGKSTISTFISGSNDRLDVDSLIKYLGFGDSVHYEELYENLEDFVQNGLYKIYDFGGSTLSTLPPEIRQKFFDLFKGARVYNIRPSKSNDFSFKFLKRIIMSEKGTSNERKQELVRDMLYDLESGILEKFQTEPTIYTLERLHMNKKLQNPFVLPSSIRQEYRKGLIKLSNELKEEIFGKNSGQMGD